MKDQVESENRATATVCEITNTSSPQNPIPKESAKKHNPEVHFSRFERVTDGIANLIYFGKQGRPSQLQIDLPSFQTQDLTFIYDKLYLSYQQEWDNAKSLQSHVRYLMGILGVLATLTTTIIFSAINNEVSTTQNTSANTGTFFDFGDVLNIILNNPQFQLYLLITVALFVGIWLFCLILSIGHEKKISDLQYPSISKIRHYLSSGSELKQDTLIQEDVHELFGVVQDLHAINSSTRRALLYANLAVYIDIISLIGILIHVTSKNIQLLLIILVAALIVLIVLWMLLYASLPKMESIR